MTPGFPRRIADTQLHAYHRGNGVAADTYQRAGGEDAANARLLAGLEWTSQAATGPGAWANRSDGGALRLEWRGAHATMRPHNSGPENRWNGNALPVGTSHDPGNHISPCGALLAQMCLAVERERQYAGGGHGAGDLEGLWLFIARVTPVESAGSPDNTDSNSVRWWLGGTEAGCPSQTVPEELHDTLKGLMRSLHEIAATSPDLAGIAVEATSADRLLDSIEDTAPEIPLPVTVTPMGLAEEGPLFVQPPRGKLPMVAAAVVGCALLGIGGAWYGGLFAPRAQPEPEITFTVPVEGAVRSACLNGMAQAWPRMPGWRVSGTGCARPGSLPDDIPVPAAANQAQWFEDGGSPAASEIASDDSSVIAWRAYDRDRGANAVLAAAAGGELMNAHGQGPSHGHATTGDDGERLVLWQRLPLETRQARPGGFAPIDGIERALAQAFVDVPDAVNAGRNSVTVTITDPPHRALDRLDAAGPQVELIAVEQRNRKTTIRLRPGRLLLPDNGDEGA